MKPARLSLVPLVVLLAFVATVGFANEDTKSNPYESIAARNPFQLKDPPPPPDPNEMAKPPPPPLATVEVTGVLNMLSKKKVLLEIVPGPGKPPIKPTLEEGERVEMVEVLFIDVENSEVKINNGGVITNIALRTPTKAPVGPAGPIPGVQPGFPPPVLAPNTSAGIVPPVVNPNAASPNAYDRGNVMVVGGTPVQATPTATGVGGKQYGAYGAGSPVVGGSTAYGNQPAYNSGGSGVNVTGGGELRTIPSRPIRTNPQSTATPDQSHNDPAQQYINMAIQKQQNEARRIPMPPLPPIPGFDPGQ
jgi:hypothetical protein